MLALAVNGIDLGRGRGGNESYLRGLIGGLEREPQVGALHVLVGRQFPLQTSHTKTSYIQTGTYRRLPYLLWQQSLALRHLHYDWYLSTFFLPALPPRHCALFAHDFSFMAWPQSYPLSIRLYMRVLVGWAMQRARTIIVLSEFVRSELERFFPAINPARVHVIYPGLSREFSAIPSPADPSMRARYALNGDYILSVSNIHPRKNLSGLLQAYQQLKAQMGAALPPLVIVGQRYWGSTILEAQAQAIGARLLGYVPQADLPAIYRAARALVYPSLYEGFGLPPLEAMASGVPVICDDRTSLPEAVGDAALMVNAREPAQIASALEQLLTEKNLRATLIQRGFERARLFDWQRTANQLVTILIQG